MKTYKELTEARENIGNLPDLKKLKRLEQEIDKFRSFLFDMSKQINGLGSDVKEIAASEKEGKQDTAKQLSKSLKVTSKKQNEIMADAKSGIVIAQSLLNLAKQTLV